MSKLKQLAQDAVKGIASEQIVTVYPNGEAIKLLIREAGYQDSEDVQAMFQEVREDLEEAYKTKDEDAGASSLEELGMMYVVLCTRDPETEELLWEFEEYEELLDNCPSWVKRLIKPALLVNGFPIEDVEETDDDKPKEETAVGKSKKETKKPSRKSRRRRKGGNATGDTQT